MFFFTNFASTCITYKYLLAVLFITYTFRCVLVSRQIYIINFNITIRAMYFYSISCSFIFFQLICISLSVLFIIVFRFFFMVFIILFDRSFIFQDVFRNIYYYLVYILPYNSYRSYIVLLILYIQNVCLYFLHILYIYIYI